MSGDFGNRPKVQICFGLSFLKNLCNGVIAATLQNAWKYNCYMYFKDI